MAMDKNVALARHTDMQGSAVGHRLKALRKELGFTMSEMAARSGVSAGMISQIERGMSNPSIRVLERLRQALNVPLTALIEAEQVEPADESSFVRRESERPYLSVGAHGMSKELLSPNGDHDMQFMLITIPARSSSIEVLIGPGEKAGLVFEGELELRVDNKIAKLGPGDSFQFSSLLSHSVHNNTEQPAKLLWIMNTKRPSIQL
jgi:transcriptional regulator with XRE-family HTH domain